MAQPASPPGNPGLAVDWGPRWHLAFRVGWSSFAGGPTDGLNEVAGTSPIGELEIAAHLIPDVTLALWGDYSAFHYTWLEQGDGTTVVLTPYAVRIVDVGGRISYDNDGAFVGVGMFAEVLRMTSAIDSRVYSGPSFELHVGHTFPNIGHIAPQIFGMVSGAPGDGGVSARLTIGARI